MEMQGLQSSGLVQSHVELICDHGNEPFIKEAELNE